MKKILLIVLTATMIFAFAGCGGGGGDAAGLTEGDVVGSWQMVSYIDSDGKEMDQDMFDLFYGDGGIETFVFNEGGTGTQTLLGLEFEVTWEISEGKLMVDDGYGTIIEFTWDGEHLSKLDSLEGTEGFGKV